MAHLVYFSSVSENTHRFVQKLARASEARGEGPCPAIRIPLRGDIEVDTPYVLIVPTYGGGHPVPGKAWGYVPKQVVKFLNNENNRSLIRGVIAAGNTNFGAEYCYAGKVISAKCDVPYLYRFELMGTAEDVEQVLDGLDEFWKDTPWRQPRQLQNQ